MNWASARSMSADYTNYVKKNGAVEVPDGCNVIGQAQKNAIGPTLVGQSIMRQIIRS
jgi:hypothetical protein